LAPKASKIQNAGSSAGLEKNERAVLDDDPRVATFQGSFKLFTVHEMFFAV
jgi:hypothetical protein